MGGHRRSRAILLALPLVLALLPAGLAAGSLTTNAGCGNLGCGLAVQEDIEGDYWAADVAVPEEATLEDGSTIELTAWFDERTDETGFLVLLEDLDNDVVRFGIVVWTQGEQPGVSVYQQAPVGKPASVEVRATRPMVWDGVGVEIVQNVDIDLDANQHRLVIAAPTADALDVNLDLQADQPMGIVSEINGSTAPHGALVDEEDWDAATSLQATGVGAMMDASYDLSVPEDRRLYGYHGPASSGISAIGYCPYVEQGLCGAFLGGYGTTWGHSIFGVERPDASSQTREISYPVCTFATCPAGPGQATAFVPTAGQAGDWTFTVDEHEAFGATPQMIAVLAPIQLPP